MKLNLYAWRWQLGGLLCVTVTAMAYFTTVATAVATLAYGLLCIGFLLRRQNVLCHSRLMKAGIGLDLLLVLTLELTRSAVATALAMKLEFWQQLHILFSSLAVLGYFPLLYLGGRLLRQKSWATADSAKLKKMQKRHKVLGITTFILRTLGFVLMFSML